MKQKRLIIKIDDELCNGCGECVPSCAEGALQIVDGKARLVAEKYCDGLGACLGDCPMGALTLEEEIVDAFDEEAVEELLASQKAPAGGCPGTAAQTFTPAPAPAASESPATDSTTDSALDHWPVKLKLVQAQTPFLNNSELVITADCAPVALANYNKTFLPGKVGLIACPKFDDVEAYFQKLVQIFTHNTIKHVSVLMMEVPCCSGLGNLVATAAKHAGKEVPMDQVIVARNGNIIAREPLQAQTMTPKL